MMFLSQTLFLITFALSFTSYLGQFTSVQIKSHKVLTTLVDSRNVELTYDDSRDTAGLFYSITEQIGEVEYDLGKNYLIDHVAIKLKQEDNVKNLSVSVGNSVNGQEQLLYNCKRSADTKDEYKCEPECRSLTKPQPGVIARKFLLKILLPMKWISIHDVRVYSSPVKVSDDISSNRLLLPLNCASNSWSVTTKTNPKSQQTVTTTPIDIFFEKPYVVTEVDVEFKHTAPTTIELEMISGRDKPNLLTISLSGCQSQKSLFTCLISEKTVSSTHVRVKTVGVTKFSIRGKPAFYPKVDLQTTLDGDGKLRMSCEYKPCDLSVHSDCTESAIKAGEKFDCVNKQLIRLGSASQPDVFIIVNNGKVEDTWNSTKFRVETNNKDKLVVSMPMSYQYFGQYQCACIVSDKINTVVNSNATQLKETDFLEELIFDFLVQYKLSDGDNAPHLSVSNNIIYQHKSQLEITFLPLKVTIYSLVADNSIEVNYPNGVDTRETSTVDRSSPHSTKSFPSIPQSWNVSTHKYVVDEMFPEFIHRANIYINCLNKNLNRKEGKIVTYLDGDVVKLNPMMWSSNDSKTISIKAIYAGADEAILRYLEKTCSGTKKTPLATFSSKMCVAKDARVKCAKLAGATFVEFIDDLSFSKTYTVGLINAFDSTVIKNVTIESKVSLSQNDVLVEPKNMSITLNKKNVTVVKLELQIVSTKIRDFLACGNVFVKIFIENKDMQQMVLQNMMLPIDVEMVTPIVKVKVEISIEGVAGKHVADLNVTDPKQLSVKNLEFQQEDKMNIVWRGIDDMASNCLEKYELTFLETVVACNTTKSTSKTVSKLETSGDKRQYKVQMIPINKNHLTKISVSVQPVFVGNQRGQRVMIARAFGMIGPSSLVVDGVVMTRDVTVVVTPSQTNIDCPVKETEFTLSSSEVDTPRGETDSLGKMKYRLKNLVPGRNYELTAKVLYKYGPEDTPSKPYVFQTADEITILKTIHLAEVNERINISCTAEIGPKDRHQKSVDWLRADRSALPRGVASVKSTSTPGVAYLIIEKALSDYSGEYGCFANPPAASGSMKITIVVNDLLVAPMKQKVDFVKKEGKVSVTCSSLTGELKDLSWVDPLGQSIPEDDSKHYTVIKVVTEKKINRATLIIKDPSLTRAGKFLCYKAVVSTTAKKEFFLYGVENVEIRTLTNSSTVGDTLKLRCQAQAGLPSQNVVWESYPMNNAFVSLTKISQPYPNDTAIQDIEIINNLDIQEVRCKLMPNVEEGKDYLFTSRKIELAAKVVVNGSDKVDFGSTTVLTCLGYPSKPKMQLKWVFYRNKTSKGKVIKTSDGLPEVKSHEPIKLELKLTNVKEVESGRYECRFSDESRSVVLKPGQSISLAVNPLTNAVNDPGKGGNSLRRTSTLATVFWAALGLLFTAFCRQ